MKRDNCYSQKKIIRKNFLEYFLRKSKEKILAKFIKFLLRTFVRTGSESVPHLFY